MQNQYSLIYLTILSTTLTIFVCALSVIYFVYKYKKKSIELYNKTEMERIKIEKDRLKIELEIQEETFSHISKEIHDNISLSLTLSKLYLNTFLIERKEKILEIENSIDLISKSLIDLNDLSKSVDGDTIHKYGLIHCIEQEINKIKNSTKISVQLQIIGEIFFFSPDIELMIFRIIQEAFNNILKHSKANNSSLSLEYNPDYLMINIQDDGIGFDVIASRDNFKSSGLKNIERRASMINSKLSINSTIDSGAIINLEIPYIR